MSRRSLASLARRIASGDLEAARRAVAILEASGDEGALAPLVARIRETISATGGDPSGAVRSAVVEEAERRDGAESPPWIRWFGVDWRVPWQFLRLVEGGLAHDGSWHDDACPSIQRTFESGARLVLWSGHPNPAVRDHHTTHRFAVSWVTPEGEWPWDVARTDDVLEALDAFLQAARDMESGRSPRRHSPGA